jgi:hypothetical protein
MKQQKEANETIQGLVERHDSEKKALQDKIQVCESTLIFVLYKYHVCVVAYGSATSSEKTTAKRRQISIWH